MQGDQRRVSFLDGCFQIDTEAGESFGETGVGLRTRAPELHSESAQVIAPAAVAMIVARQVDVLAPDAIVVLSGGPQQLRQESVHMEANLLHKVTADDIAGIT